jgi:hypothetical protein
MCSMRSSMRTCSVTRFSITVGEDGPAERGHGNVLVGVLRRLVLLGDASWRLPPSSGSLPMG